jgi:hypothetical protein
MRKSGILTLVTFAMLLVVTASAEAFDVKTGLWQIDATRQMMGAPMMQSYKSCLTQAELNQGFKPDNPACTSKVLSKSSSGEKVRMDCSNQMGTMSMVMNWHIIDRKHAVGTSEQTMTSVDGRTMRSTGNMKAKWVSSDCGNVN